jgi:AcrR family transcriptional regulator
LKRVVAEEADGRRLRSERSRALIVDALFALIRAGDMDPVAARVAERAGVGLRTVFRHFEDMDSLYREMSARVEAEILPLTQRPFAAADWRGRVFELLARRADIYERILPLRVAGAVRRFQSAYLMEDYRRVLGLERAGLHAILPKSVLANATLAAALDLAMSFDSWRRLRQDVGMRPAVAEATMRLTVERLIA